MSQTATRYVMQQLRQLAGGSTLTDRELLAALDAELMKLPAKYRTPLLLCSLEGATRDEAAQQLGCPLGTLKSRLERGRQLLYAALQRRGLTLSTGLIAVLLGEVSGQ